MERVNFGTRGLCIFIVAATVCRYVADSNFDPRERLQEVLQFQGIGQLEQMAKTYLPV